MGGASYSEHIETALDGIGGKPPNIHGVHLSFVSRYIIFVFVCMDRVVR